MNATNADDIRNKVAAVLVVSLSMLSIVAVTFYCFLFGRPDGAMPTPAIPFLLPAVGIYLLLTLVGAAAGAWLWCAAPLWLSLFAAIPYLCLALGHGLVWLGVALFTAALQYVAIHLRRAGSEPTVA